MLVPKNSRTKWSFLESFGHPNALCNIVPNCDNGCSKSRVFLCMVWTTAQCWSMRVAGRAAFEDRSYESWREGGGIDVSQTWHDPNGYNQNYQNELCPKHWAVANILEWLVKGATEAFWTLLHSSTSFWKDLPYQSLLLHCVRIWLQDRHFLSIVFLCAENVGPSFFSGVEGAGLSYPIFSTDPTQIPWAGYWWYCLFFLRLRLERQTSRSKWKCWMQLCWVMESFLWSTSTPWRLKDTLTVIPDSRQRLQKCHGSIAVISSFWMWLGFWDIWAFHKKHWVGAVSNTLQLPFESFSVQTLTNRIRQGANEDNEKMYLWEGLKTVKVLCFYMFPCVSGFTLRLDMPSSCGTFWRIHRSIGARARWSHVISTFWSFWHSHAASLLDRIRNGPQMYDDPCCHHSNNLTHSYIERFCPQCVHTMGFLRHCRGVKGWVDPGLAPACPSNFVTLDLPFWRKSRWKHTQ